MREIRDKDIARNRYLLLYDDEPVMTLVVMMRDEESPQEWWHVLVDVDEGGYAVARISDVTAAIEKEGKALLDKPAGDLIGTVFTPVETIVERAGADYNAFREQVHDTESQVGVVLEDGELSGLIPVGGTRAGGVFDTGLVQMAGQYGDIPERGLLSQRRGKKSKKKAKK